MNRPVVILGGGPAGIGAALALGADATMLERGAQVAGLASTIVLEGAVFDLGGHSFHTPHPRVRDLVFGALEMEEQRRNAWCWTQGSWIAYPFQKHVGDIPEPKLRAACIAGMAAADDGGAAANFDAYIEARFGAAVADAFLRPYNRKLWGEDLTRLSKDWAGERVAGPWKFPEEFDERGGNRTPLQAETRIAYPAQGGFGAIFEALGKRVKDLRLGMDIVGIDPMRRRLTSRCGQSFEWERLVSTLPLPALLNIVAGVPPALLQAAAWLEPIPVALVMVVLEGRGPIGRQRVYCPDADMPGHKIVLNHTASAWLRDRQRHGIQIEVSGARPWAAGMSAQVVENLRRIGLIGKPDEVRRVEVMRLVHGYPAPTHARDAIIRDIRQWLAAHGIHLCGRFAEWAYINADEALARGLALGQRLSADAAEYA